MNKFNINTGKKIKNSKKELIGYTSSLSAAISYGISAILAKIIVGQITTPLIASSFALFFGFFTLSIIFYKQLINIKSIDKKTFLFLFLAGLASCIGVGAQYYAMNNAPVILVAPITGANALFAILFGSIFLKKIEKITPLTVMGAFMIIIGIIIIILSRT